MRYLRLCIGFSLLFGALYIIVVEQMAGASSDAFINAPLSTVRAPVAGDVSLPDRAPGAIITKGAALFEIENARVDRVRLNDLQLERDLLAAERERYVAERDARQEALRWIQTTAGKYAAARTGELVFQTGEIASDRDVSRGPDETTAREANGSLVEDKLAPDADDPARFLELSNVIPDGGAENFGDLQAARDVIYHDGSASAAWNMALRQREAKIALALVKADITRAEKQLAAYETRIERELSSVVGLRGDTLYSPVNGVLWQELAANGVNVQRGDPIMDIADCASVLVTLSVSETIYNSLSTGDAAMFRPLGGDRVMRGTVARLAGSGAASVYEGMAVAPSEEHLQRYDVALVVPELRADPAKGCSIGRTGRVFFDDRPLDILWKFWE
ncbi:HlyD family efflux transporter periplasmic adaptor subunit [Pseudooceanicola sp.]|uniref:HlyD family efflux transporter periplasmic adaptor subunit n=1 Tax=Pseudooceanicola sp. TaxID=1914328 RepID=UPI0035C6BFB8